MEPQLIAPMALALADAGPGGAGWETSHLSLLCLCWVVLSFCLKSAHRGCGVAPSVGSRDGHANELQSTPCVIRPPLPAAVVYR
jgi:hypothetical protein